MTFLVLVGSVLFTFLTSHTVLLKINFQARLLREYDMYEGALTKKKKKGTIIEVIIYWLLLISELRIIAVNIDISQVGRMVSLF